LLARSVEIHFTFSADLLSIMGTSYNEFKAIIGFDYELLSAYNIDFHVCLAAGFKIESNLRRTEPKKNVDTNVE
jgi:hypothetical protein